MRLQDLVSNFIEYRKSLGEKFESNQRVLKAYVKFIGADIKHTEITEEKNLAFLYHPTGKITAYWFVKHTALRGLFTWAVSREIMTFFPLPLEIPRRLGHIPAYIYNQKELNALFSCKLKSTVYYEECVRFILKLTYLLGLRISETIALTIKDIDLTNDVVYIKPSKFFKARFCPFNSFVKNDIQSFLEWRKTQKMPQNSDAVLFYNKDGNPIKLYLFQSLFIRIRKIVGLDSVVAGRFKPRIHDLRHTFGVNRLRTWYEQG